MNKSLLTKIIKTINCSNLDISDQYVHYVEIFSNVKYKDYYLRGQVATFLDPLYDIKYHDLTSIGHYYFFFFVLVNNEYQENLKMLNWESDFGIFVGNTIDEFLEEATNHYNRDVPDHDVLIGKKSPLILTEPIASVDKIIPVSVEKKDLEIKESTYLKKMVEEGKDIILLDMNLILDSVEDSSEGKNIKITYPPRIYSFPAFNYSDIWELERNDLKFDYEIMYPHSNLDFIKNLFDIICLDMDYNYLSRKDFLIILKDIGNLAWDFIEEKKINETYLEYLNEVQEEIGDRNYPFTNFVYKFLDELVADLVKQNQISQCQYQLCGKFFPINNKQKTKKYCSLKYEGRDCAKKARNKKYYAKHSEEIKPKARKSRRELRACYKKYGVKK